MTFRRRRTLQYGVVQHVLPFQLFCTSHDSWRWQSHNSPRHFSLALSVLLSLSQALYLTTSSTTHSLSLTIIISIAAFIPTLISHHHPIHIPWSRCSSTGGDGQPCSLPSQLARASIGFCYVSTCSLRAHHFSITTPLCFLVLQG